MSALCYNINARVKIWNSNPYPLAYKFLDLHAIVPAELN